MNYKTPAAFRAALEARLANEAQERNVALDRLWRRTVFERLLVRLDLAAPGMWVLKGGMALEVRWMEAARTTKDLDLATRLVPNDGNALHERLVGLLASDPEEDGFRFEVRAPRQLTPDEAGRPGWHFSVTARLAGRNFSSIGVDIVARPEELASTERLLLPGALRFAGFPPHDVEAVDRAQHFAEKIHALTRNYGRENTRVRDLLDLVLLIEDGLDPSRQVLHAAEVVFDARSTHELPSGLQDPPTFWAGDYERLAAGLAVEATTIDQAMDRLRAFWAGVLATKED